MMSFALNRPTYRAIHSFDLFLAWRSRRRTFVETHDDVTAEFVLNLHCFFRSQEMFRSINVRTELDAMFLNLANTFERENLKSSGVRENRFVPSYKGVQTS